MIQTVLRYPGAKWVLSKWICGNLPPHEVYLEPFFGSGAVLFGKEPCRTETINDIDGDVVNLFKTIRERADELCEAVSLTPWARDEYYGSYTECDTSDDVERARVFLVRCWQAFGTRTGQRSVWRNRTTGKSPKEPDIWHKLPERIQAIADRLLRVQIENADALSLIDRYNAPNCLIYADPPYMADTRSKNIYAYECDDGYHARLLDKLTAHGGSVVLSGYDNPLYRERLKDWRRVEKDARAELGMGRREVLWIKDADAAKEVLERG
jgi:DNA adenine methylase